MTGTINYQNIGCVKMAVAGANKQIVITPTSYQHTYLVLVHNISWGSSQPALILIGYANQGTGGVTNLGPHEADTVINDGSIVITTRLNGGTAVVITDDKDALVVGN